MTSRNYPADENEFDKKAKEMKNPNTMEPKWRGVGSKTGVRAEKVVMRDSKTGKVYGTRTIMQKTTEHMKFSDFLQQLAEASDITEIPERLVKEIKKNVRAGAMDLEQPWKNALELVNKAYHVTNVRLPLPNQKGAWRQYEELIKYGVHQLADARGIDTEWRSSDVLVSEARDEFDILGTSEPDLPSRPAEELGHISPRRIFVEMPGMGQVEVHAKDFDEFIDKLENHLRSKGARLRVDERSEKHVNMSIMVRGGDGNWYKRDQIKMKEYS